MPRQALYACDTCTGPGETPAGVCLACSYECHEGHTLHELYTKRYFGLQWFTSKQPKLGLTQELSLSPQLVIPLQVTVVQDGE